MPLIKNIRDTIGGLMQDQSLVSSRMKRDYQDIRSGINQPIDYTDRLKGKMQDVSVPEVSGKFRLMANDVQKNINVVDELQSKLNKLPETQDLQSAAKGMKPEIDRSIKTLENLNSNVKAIPDTKFLLGRNVSEDFEDIGVSVQEQTNKLKAFRKVISGIDEDSKISAHEMTKHFNDIDAGKTKGLNGGNKRKIRRVSRRIRIF